MAAGPGRVRWGCPSYLLHPGLPSQWQSSVWVRANSAKTLCTFSQRQKALLVCGNAPCKLDNNPFNICKHCHLCVCLALQAIAQTVKKKSASGSWEFQESPFLLQTHPAPCASTHPQRPTKLICEEAFKSAFSVNSHSREANRSQNDWKDSFTNGFL